MRRYGPLIGLILLALAAAVTTPASAHAQLLRSNPEANAVLERAPALVELFFSEGLEPAFSSVQVLDTSGRRVDNRDPNVDSVDPTHLTVTLPPLPDGLYTVAWNALSTADGHATTGAFQFVVGNGGSGEAPSPEQATPFVGAPPGEIAAKWLLYLAAAALAGGPLFLLAVWQPAVDRWGRETGRGGPVQGPWHGLAVVSLCILLIAAVLGLLLQAGLAAGTAIAAPWSQTLGTLLFTTRFGALWSGRLLLAFALAAVLRRPSSRRAQAAALALAIGLLLTVSLGAHAATEPYPILPVLDDWLHLLGVSAWVGGLIHFAAGLAACRGLDPADRTTLIARLIPRFSAVAMISVAAIALSGLYSAYLRVGSWDGLLHTAYGSALIVKSLLVLPMVAFGAVNLLIVSPRMRQGAAQPDGSPGLVHAFRRTVGTEVGLGISVLLAAAVLTSLPPARAVSSGPRLRLAGRAEDLRVVLLISPGRVGINTFTLTLTDSGLPVEGAKEAILRFTPLTADIPPTDALLTEQGDGQYGAQGGYLSQPGSWQVRVILRREGMFDSFVDLDLEMTPIGSSRSVPWSRITGALMFLAAFPLLAALGFRKPGDQRWIGPGGSAALAFLIVGASVAFRPVPTRDLVNPNPPTGTSVASGRALYEQDCVPCHGVGGRGDGPYGLVLNPRPADLTLHALPGVHTDGQLFDWISNGYPGSVMPAWEDRLPASERWDLVNFIRTLAATPQP